MCASHISDLVTSLGCSSCSAAPFPHPTPRPKGACRADYAPRLTRHSRPLPSLPRAQKCGIDGEDAKGYKEKYGATADGQGGVNFTFITKYNTTGGNGTNVGTRLFLLESPDKYKMFQLLNKEFTFTVDGSALPCGLNGAVYFVEMEADGGKSKYPTNTAGAAYGTGYCDAQCPHDIKWIAGQANLINWNPSPSDPNGGAGKFGTCCAELDIWEANVISTQMTVHACETAGYHPCDDIECGDNPNHRFDGVCDKNGCDANPYRQGLHDFYGPGPSFTLDATKPMQVVTQFITDDGTDTGNLVEMRRFYVQDSKFIYPPNPSYTPPGKNYTAISDEMCQVQMTNFSDRFDVFTKKGGIAGMGAAMNQRQFMNQLLVLMQRVELDVQTVKMQQSQTRQRLLEAERERLKMTSLAEQDARNVQLNLNKREQRQIDALGLSRFNLRDAH